MWLIVGCDPEQHQANNSAHQDRNSGKEQNRSFFQSRYQVLAAVFVEELFSDRAATDNKIAVLRLIGRLFVHYRTGLSDAALHQIGFDFELLMRTQVDHRVERQITW